MRATERLHFFWFKQIIHRLEDAVTSVIDNSISGVIKSPTYARLVEIIGAGSIAVIGAGISVPLGYPRWKKLLDQLGALAEKTEPTNSRVVTAHDSQDFLVRATEYSRVLKSKLNLEIAAIYGLPLPKPLGEMQKSLVRIPFEQFLTTNYDFVIEEAYKSVYSGSSPPRFDLDQITYGAEFLARIGQLDLPQHVIHVHGSVSRADQIVLTVEDYGQRYTLSPNTRHVLKTILTIRPLVFIGFSLSDEHFLQVLNELKTYFYSDESKHVAILPSPGTGEEAELCQRLEVRYGITPLFFDSSNDFAALTPLLKQLAADSSKKRQEVLTAVVAPSIRRAVQGIAAGRKKVEVEEVLTALPSAFSYELVQSSSRVARVDIDDINSRTPLDDEIERHFEFVKSGQPGTALALFDALISKESGTLTPRLSFRLHANRGNALVALGKNKMAAEAYLRAREYWSSKDARALEVLAYLLQDKREEALVLATSLCNEFPDFARAHAFRLKALPKGTLLKQCYRSAPRGLRRDSEVASTLSIIARDCGDIRAYEVYARTAAKAAPEWADGWLQLGTAIYQRERENPMVDVDRGTIITGSLARLEEAATAFDKALELVGSAPADIRASILFNRAGVRRMLGNEVGALGDIAAAYAIAPERHEIVAAMAWIKQRSRDNESSIQVLEAYSEARSHADTCVVWAFALRSRRKEGDLAFARNLLEPWIDGNKSFADYNTSVSEFVRLLSEIMEEMGERPKALSLYEGLRPDLLPKGLREANIARLLFDPKSKATVGRSSALLEEAAKAVSTKHDWYLIREVAFIGAQIKRFDIACVLLRRIVPETVLNSDGETLLRWAHEGGQDAITLEYCATLRNKGVFHKGAVAEEIDALIRNREPQKAIALMQQWLAKFDDKMMRLNLSIVGILQRNPSLVEKDPAKLPAVSELAKPEHGQNLVAALRKGAGRSVALRAAYQLWRRFSDSPVAQQVLIYGVMNAHPPEPALETAEHAGNSSVVTVSFDDGSSRQFVIEEGSDPRAAFNEFAPEHPVSKAILDRRVGESVTIGNQRGVVKQIQNKILYRAQTCLSVFETNFPEGDIRSVNVNIKAENARDPKVAFGELFDVLKAEEKRKNYLLGLYRSRGLPASMLAHALGKTVFETMLHLATQDDIGVHVATGDAAAFKNSEDTLKRSRAVVLDSSAIATLVILGLERKIGQLPFKCLVPDSAVQELRDLLGQRDLIEKPSALIATEGERVVMSEFSAEEQIAWARKLEGIVEILTSQCEVVGGSDTLELPKQLVEAGDKVGLSVIDAIAVARKRNLPLWTDDLKVDELICMPLKIDRVWTQPVLEFWAADGMDATLIQKSVTKLAASGYRFTRMSVAMILDAFKAEKWNNGEAQTKRLIKYVGEASDMSVANCESTRLLLMGIWRNCRSEKKATRLVFQVLDGISRSTAIRFIAKPLYHPSDLFFPLGDGAWRRFRQMLRRWRTK